ncbi:MAG: hypothetical protein WD022_03750 [Balneolaceae bacterium]
MRATLTSILLFIASGFFLTANAQVTAVMQAKVTIISGAGFSAIQETSIDLNSDVFLSEDLETGSFSLVAAPGSDVSVNITQQSEIVNELGEVIEFESFTVDQNSTDSGDHHITVNGKLKDQQQIFNGHYQGAVTAVVEYL